jgi:hypothetical protein
MQVQVLVTLDVDPIDPDDDKGSTGEFQAAAVEAVKNAVDFAEQNGFCHALAEVACIGIVSIELME